MPPVEAEAAAELTPAVPETPAPAVTEGEAVTAPVVGVFYSASAPGAAPFVKVGDRVQKGQTLCIVEAMKMMNEITADFDGIVTEIAPKDGRPGGIRLRRSAISRWSEYVPRILSPTAAKSR